MNRLDKVTEFRDYFKFRIDRLIRRCCSIPVLARAEAEKGYMPYRQPSVRFFVANNLDLIYNYALKIVINYGCADCTV